MKNNKNLKTICLSVVAMALIITLSVGTALAYFTTHTTAKGGVKLDFAFAYSEIIEEVDPAAGWKKVTLENTGTVDCYVRMKAFAGSERGLSYSGSADDRSAAVENWECKDGYYEYSEILKPGERTKTPVYVHFNVPSDGTTYNVIVVQECTPVLHNEDGSVKSAEWNSEGNTGFLGN